MKNNNLDEQQERTLLEIESKGCRMVLWGLSIAAIAQMQVTDDFRIFIGEVALLLLLGLYLGVSCMRAGIWDRSMDMSRKSSVIASLIGALCMAVLRVVTSYLRSSRMLVALCSGVIMGVFTFAAIYFGLRLMARVMKKRQDALNAEPQEELE